MDTRFFKSKEFAISAVVALILAGGAAFAIGGDLTPGGAFSQQGCSVPVPSGTPIDASVDDTGAIREDGRVRRVVTHAYDMPVDGTVGLDACTRVGDIRISPGATDRVVMRFTISNDGPGAQAAVEDLEVRSMARSGASGLSLAGWQATHTRAEAWFDSQSTRTTVEIELPATASYSADLETDVGDITLASLTYRDLHLDTDVGDIEGTGVSLVAGMIARTDVGDIEMGLASVGTGTWDLKTDVGDIDLSVPVNEDTGYDVEASTDVGDIDLEIGPTEHQRHDSRGPSEEATARTEGFADKANQVTIDARTDVGSIDVIGT